MSKEIFEEIKQSIKNMDFDNLTEEDYRELLDKVFYERLQNKASEKIDPTQGGIILSKNEILSTSPQYKNPSNFSLIDDDSSIIVSVTPNRLEGGEALEFVLPFRNKTDLERFINLLQYLDSISKIKYPEEEIELI